jgi:hypothetical protein
MSLTIRWTTPLNLAERRWLDGWLSRFRVDGAVLIQPNHRGITVYDDDLDVVHTFAALTMAIIGRPRFAYELVLAGTPAVLDSRRTSTGPTVRQNIEMRAGTSVTGAWRPAAVDALGADTKSAVRSTSAD